MNNLKRNIEGIDIPEDILRIIKSANTDGSISSIKHVLKRESEALTKKTNQNFKELCRTLDNEQMRLVTLENKRQRLLEEMLQLKEDIRKEKESCQSDLEAVSVNSVNIQSEKSDDISDLVEIDDDEDEIRTIFPGDSNNFGQQSENAFFNNENDPHRLVKRFQSNNRTN